MIEKADKVWPVGAMWHRVEPYGQPVCFVQTQQDYIDALAYYGIKHKASAVFGLSQWCASKNTAGVAFFMVGVFDGHYSTLVHELAHTAFFLLEHVGVPVKAGAPNEAYCYLLDNLYDTFAPHLKQEKPARKRKPKNEPDDKKSTDV